MGWDSLWGQKAEFLGGLRWRSDHSGVRRSIKPWREEKAESSPSFISDGLRALEMFREMKNSTQRTAALWLFRGTQDTLDDQNTSLVQPHVLRFPL